MHIGKIAEVANGDRRRGLMWDGGRESGRG